MFPERQYQKGLPVCLDILQRVSQNTAVFIKGSQNISAQLSMKITLMDPNLVRNLFGNNFFDPNYVGAH